MDLVSFIPGIGPTAAFTPGPNTPSPFNVTHTGMTDGTSPSTASLNQAEVYNRLLLQLAAVIVTAGLTVDHDNWTQLTTAIQTIAATGNLPVVTYNADFVNVLAAASGWQKFKGGLKKQWIELSVPSADNDIVTITWPNSTLFGTYSGIPMTSVYQPGMGIGDTSNFIAATIASYSLTGCTVGLGQNGGGSRAIVLRVEAEGE